MQAKRGGKQIFVLALGILVVLFLGSLFLAPSVSLRELEPLNKKLEEMDLGKAAFDGLFVVGDQLAVLERGQLVVSRLDGEAPRIVANPSFGGSPPLGSSYPGGEASSFTISRGSVGGVALPHGKLLLLLGGGETNYPPLYSGPVKYFEGIELVDLEKASSKLVRFADRTTLGISPVAVVLESGKVFIVGQGESKSPIFEQTYLLDPDENKFFKQKAENLYGQEEVQFFTKIEHGPELRLERQMVELFALSDGRILIGGMDKSGKAAELEVFDPRTNTISIIPNSPSFSYPIFIKLSRSETLVADLRESEDSPVLVSLPKLEVQPLPGLHPQVFGEDIFERLKKERSDPRSPLYQFRNIGSGQTILNLGPLLALYGWAYFEAGPGELARLLIIRQSTTSLEYSEFIRQIKERAKEGELNRWIRIGLSISETKLPSFSLYFGSNLQDRHGSLTGFDRVKIASAPGYASYILASVEERGGKQKTILYLLTMRSYASFTKGFLSTYLWAQFWKLMGGLLLGLLLVIAFRRRA